MKFLLFFFFSFYVLPISAHDKNEYSEVISQCDAFEYGFYNYLENSIEYLEMQIHEPYPIESKNFYLGAYERTKNIKTIYLNMLINKYMKYH